MMDSIVELLKEQETTLDVAIVSPYLVTFIVFISSPFPYRKRIRDWQINKFKGAVSYSYHKYLLSLLFFFCGAATRNQSCAQYETEPYDVVLRFMTKSCWAILSYVVLYKICAILLSKPLEPTVKDKSQ